MVDTDDTRRTTDDRRRTTPQVWHKLPTGELKTREQFNLHQIKFTERSRENDKVIPSLKPACQ